MSQSINEIRSVTELQALEVEGINIVEELMRVDPNNQDLPIWQSMLRFPDDKLAMFQYFGDKGINFLNNYTKITRFTPAVVIQLVDWNNSTEEERKVIFNAFAKNTSFDKVFDLFGGSCALEVLDAYEAAGKIDVAVELMNDSYYAYHQPVWLRVLQNVPGIQGKIGLVQYCGDKGISFVDANGNIPQEITNIIGGEGAMGAATNESEVVLSSLVKSTPWNTIFSDLGADYLADVKLAYKTKYDVAHGSDVMTKLRDSMQKKQFSVSEDEMQGEDAPSAALLKSALSLLAQREGALVLKIAGDVLYNQTGADDVDLAGDYSGALVAPVDGVA
jgi:hypothetical protein